jgi:YHS domain-containing protein
MTGKKLHIQILVLAAAVLALAIVPAQAQTCCGKVSAEKADPPKWQPQTLCPVTGRAINKDIFADYQGKRIYFCCPGCLEKFKQNPDMYMKKFQEEGIALEKSPAGTRAEAPAPCPMAGQRPCDCMKAAPMHEEFWKDMPEKPGCGCMGAGHPNCPWHGKEGRDLRPCDCGCGCMGAGRPECPWHKEEAREFRPCDRGCGCKEAWHGRWEGSDEGPECRCHSREARYEGCPKMREGHEGSDEGPECGRAWQGHPHRHRWAQERRRCDAYVDCERDGFK